MAIFLGKMCKYLAYKLQKCEKYNLPQIHHIRIYYNSIVLWDFFNAPYCLIELNCVYTGHNLMNCMVLYAQFRLLLYLVV